MMKTVTKKTIRDTEKADAEFRPVVLDQPGRVTNASRPRTGEIKSIAEGRVGALQESWLQAILDNTSAVIYSKDVDGRYLFVNGAFESLFQLDREQVVGKTDYDLFPTPTADKFRINDLRVLDQCKPTEFEEKVPVKEDVRTYLSVKFPLVAPSGETKAVCGISTDITERKKTELELGEANRTLLALNRECDINQSALRQALCDLRKSHKKLEATQHLLIQAEKMETIGLLASNLVHEIRNVLSTVIEGLDYFDKTNLDMDENGLLAKASMRESVKKGTALVQDLLTLAKKKHLDICEENINEVIERALVFMRLSMIQKGIKVRREYGENLRPIHIDKAKIEQVFLNLFLNAMNAMERGGVLRVRTYAKAVDAELHELFRNAGCMKSIEEVVVAEVNDSGPGIPEERLEKVFEPFYSSRASGVGTGLGLPISKQIIDIHGGLIRLRSQPEEGVCASIYLPNEFNGRR